MSGDAVERWAEAWREADTREKRDWLHRLADERGELGTALAGLLRTTFPKGGSGGS